MAGKNNVDKAGRKEEDGKVDVCTPRYIIDMAIEVMGPIELDPASNPKSLVGAEYTIILPEHLPGLTELEAFELGIILGDGLETSWKNRTTWVNPPYKRGLNQIWSKKIHREGLPRIGGPDEKPLMALVPSSPGAKWFQKTYAQAAAVCFWTGRITFENVPPNPKTGKVDPADFESAVIYYGTEVEKFRKVFGKRGWIP